MARNVTNFRGDFTPDSKIKDEPVTPEGFGIYNFDYPSESGDFDNVYNMRKSMSMNDIAALREDIVKLELNEHEDNYQKQKEKRTTGHLEMSRTKFVSMAESIYHFQRDTPGRFHSTRPQTFKSQGSTGRACLTRPQSPLLRCKLRTRQVHVMSQKEKEDMELEELKKFRHKAQPIPKSVIEGPKNLPEVPKKPLTVPAPFNLTEVPKKPVDTANHVQNFKARPAPKTVLIKPHLPVKQTVHKTGPEPFSFDKYDEERKRKKEERIKQQIMEEKKQASLFKAQPLPGAVKKRMYDNSNKCSSTTSSENKENHKFEAKPPVVLYKQPFKPILPQTHSITPAPFSLNTQKRAAEREKFDQQLKEKEEEQERQRILKEKEQQEFQERANVELRAKLVHHPKPVPSFEPFVPEKSVACLTVPETPKFVRKLNNRH